MTRRYVYALLTTLLFGSFVAEGNKKTFSNDEVMEMMQAMQKEIATLKSKNEIARKTIATLQEAQERTETETKQLRDENRVLKEENKKLNAKVLSIEKWMNDRKLDAESMFFATIFATTTQINSGDAIVFDLAPINPGGHYNTSTGAYTAPVNGYYQFSVNKEGNDYTGSFFFMVDNDQYAIKDVWFGNLNPDASGSATINIQLTAGQVVSVENYGSSIVYGTDSTGFLYSWFTGHLLYAL